MSSCQVPVRRQVLVKEGQDGATHTLRTPPVPHQFSNDDKHAHGLHAGITHTNIGLKCKSLVEGSGGIGVGPDLVSCLAQGERQERGANVGHDSGDDQLLLAGCFDGGAEFGVVPGVDFAVAGDDYGMGVLCEELFGDGSVGA